MAAKNQNPVIAFCVNKKLRCCHMWWDGRTWTGRKKDAKIYAKRINAKKIRDKQQNMTFDVCAVIPITRHEFAEVFAPGLKS